eukprot:gnl/Spiro4/16532_TR8904_c0_g2_i2.p3 gnl/Spiro4/16532_TR8904_c0_g2~~gnl/Spiro4/16532_TR8904_c0_g2_i2.p3  ORF type:complete len:171 (-),score=76.95 gnl/Spiro4/16532_TR8904_c0_g2_i2:29-541(-)
MSATRSNNNNNNNRVQGSSQSNFARPEPAKVDTLFRDGADYHGDDPYVYRRQLAALGLDTNGSLQVLKRRLAIALSGSNDQPARQQPQQQQQQQRQQQQAPPSRSQQQQQAPAQQQQQQPEKVDTLFRDAAAYHSDDPHSLRKQLQQLGLETTGSLSVLKNRLRQAGKKV